MALIPVFQNLSSLAPVSDYRVEVLIGDGTPAHSTVLYRGLITGHRRADGWQVLVQRLLDQQSQSLL